MKKLICCFALCLLTTFVTVQGYCASMTLPPIEVTAEVKAHLTLTLQIHDGLSFSDPVVTKMIFGVLVLDEVTNTYSSPKVFTIEAKAHSNSVPYIVTQTGTVLTNTTGQTLPTLTQIVEPNANGEPIRVGAHYGTKGTWVGVSKVIYDSGSGGKLEVLNARYTVASDGVNNITVDQNVGVYSATITYTVTA